MKKFIKISLSIIIAFTMTMPTVSFAANNVEDDVIAENEAVVTNTEESFIEHNVSQEEGFLTESADNMEEIQYEIAEGIDYEVDYPEGNDYAKEAEEDITEDKIVIADTQETIAEQIVSPEKDSSAEQIVLPEEESLTETADEYENVSLLENDITDLASLQDDYSINLTRCAS